MSELEDSPGSSTQTRVGTLSKRANKRKGVSILEKSTGLVIYKGPCCILHMVIREYRVHIKSICILSEVERTKGDEG